jgi:8-oxo-dGTP diphosphatase
VTDPTTDPVPPLEVRAAGGIVTRPGAGGSEILVVHRPRYDDWSLPKGKVEPGESDEDCARREVLEETGIAVALGQEATSVRYRDRYGRPKVVRYWYMTVEGEGRPHPPDDEVDAVEWWKLPRAARELTYEHDRELVASHTGS